MAILHNPTLKVEPVFVPFVGKGRLTDGKKEVLKEMLENGKGQDDDGLNAIAEQLNVSFAKVKEYIQSF
jgi:DNA-binding Lrp family transcriptional regulator